ncbi:dioxygenase [Pseudomonas fragi]|uniref:dioxygenase n=1 Tax=Pseudomonas fragi TaxID=296 RepID=UPI002D790DB2|nr:dioxygenase [Pseudomonas fragi]WRT62986.1 dioxygenase [Pseudomonas fragi]
MAVLTRHLHAAIKEIEPSHDEWLRAIEFLTRTGQMCTDWRHALDRELGHYRLRHPRGDAFHADAGLVQALPRWQERPSARLDALERKQLSGNLGSAQNRVLPGNRRNRQPGVLRPRGRSLHPVAAHRQPFDGACHTGA